MFGESAVEKATDKESGNSKKGGEPLAVGGRGVGVIEYSTVVDEVANYNTAASQVPEPC